MIETKPCMICNSEPHHWEDSRACHGYCEVTYTIECPDCRYKFCESNYGTTEENAKYQLLKKWNNFQGNKSPTPSKESADSGNSMYSLTGSGGDFNKDR